MANKPYLQLVIEGQMDRLNYGALGDYKNPDEGSIRGLKNCISRLESEIDCAKITLEIMEGQKTSLVKVMQVLGYAEEKKD